MGNNKMTEAYVFDEIDLSAWNRIISKLPDAHFLQTVEWADIKENYGWQSIPLIWKDKYGSVVAGAMVLERRVNLPVFKKTIKILYSPKGPLLDWSNEMLREQVISDMEDFAIKRKAIFLKIDPDVVISKGLPEDTGYSFCKTGEEVVKMLDARHWKYSSDQIQFRNTIRISLLPDEEALLAGMKQKTRYNIRLADRKGVIIRDAGRDELEKIYEIYARTAIRDRFTIRSKDYYLEVWEKFLDAGKADILVADINGEIVAGLVLIAFSETAYYVYGMSEDEYRNYMPTYLIQWEAMKRAKARGCSYYDLWGAPEVFEESDPMWGVYKFKKGFGGEVVSTLGAWDFAVNPFLMRLYQFWLPKILEIMRKIGNKQTKVDVQGT